jgi:acetylornithine deacetylase/succinyl-diaminopimelate desuccinylase-like protein
MDCSTTKISPGGSMPEASPIYERPAELLQNLIRFDTTNPPGNERPCIEYINMLLKDAGFETTLIGNHPDRPNLITRLKGAGNAPPLLLYVHVDVVTTANQEWTHPPFEAKIDDGYIWGRGALDMKHGVAMYLAALLKAKAGNVSLPGDVIFAATVDEEAGGMLGAEYLVEEHPGLFKDVRYALSEFGGFNLAVAGKNFFLIQIAEKTACPARVTFHGPGGHAANPVNNGAMAKLGRALLALDNNQLPMHVTPPVNEMLNKFAGGLGGLSGFLFRQLLDPVLSPILMHLLGKRVSMFAPLLHNTVSPTILTASDKFNVIPSTVVLDLDGRLLPGFSDRDLQQELRTILGEDCTIETDLLNPGPTTSDMSLFETLAASLRQLDPPSIPVPYVNPAVTDARFFSLLGIQTYGFTPLQLPQDFSFIYTIHAADERVPVAAVEFGTRAVYSVLQSFH